MTNGLVPFYVLSTRREDAQQGSPSRFSDVPIILYRELSERLGIGEERAVTRFWFYRGLDQTKPQSGFAGAISLRKIDDRIRFNLWDEMPRGIDEFDGMTPALEIEYAPVRTGMNNARLGVLKRDDVLIRIPRVSGSFVDSVQGYSVTGPAVKLAALCMLRAAQLSADPSVRDPSGRPWHFWEPYEEDNGPDQGNCA